MITMFQSMEDRRLFVWQVRLFCNVEAEVKAAIFERLHRKQYVTGSKLLRKGNPVKRMYFIVRGTLSCDNQPMLKSFHVSNPEQHQDNANKFCGEELLLWHLESAHKFNASGMSLLHISRKIIVALVAIMQNILVTD